MHLKTVFAAAALAVSVALAGCGGSSEADSATVAAAEEKKVRVFVLLPSVEDEAYIREKAGAEAQKKKETNAEVTIDAGTGRGTADVLIQKIQSAVTQQYDAIAVNGGGVAKQLIPALNKAAEQGMKIIAFDQDLPGVDSKATHIGWDARRSGELLGEYWAESLPDGGKIGMIRCGIGNEMMDSIEEGFRSKIEGSKLKVVSRIDTLCDVAKSRGAAENMLTAHPDLIGIMADTDLGAEGAAQAFKAQGKNDLFLTGSSASRTLLKSMAEGGLGDATTTFPFEEFGAQAVRQAVAAARDEPLPPDNVIEPELVTKETAKKFYDEIVAISGEA